MYIIDSFEEEWAVIETKKGPFRLPRALLPVNAREGDVLRITIEKDTDETQKRKNTMEKRMNDLFE
ncbi:DUF3006 domain-containing protein [Aneurinibacillus tyrosinisolvens]|uniref:DUF3006 domain-containing protein n=1 Tax=Aneurinibacillus tyrosinisolvens TaxID=1443435 RepID=UPI00063F9EF6|nr:DUF3006 domain-containing protein [Aneurinibacillus tyrosinisolvens]